MKLKMFFKKMESLFSVRDAQSATELFDSFAVFYCVNGRLPYQQDIYLYPTGKFFQASRVKN